MGLLDTYSNKKKANYNNRSNNVFYARWKAMMYRCYNKNHRRYKNYGAKGIKVSDEFKDFWVYEEYIRTLDNCDSSLQLDRRDNNGDYERGNLRWVLCIDNILNRGKSRRNKSGFVGVAKNVYKWVSKIRVNKVDIFIGSFNTKIQAVVARDTYIINNQLNHKTQVL